MSTTLPADDIDIIRQMPVEYLEKLYPSVIKWGPQGDFVEKLLLRFEEDKGNFFKDGKRNTLSARKFRELVRKTSDFIISDSNKSREQHVDAVVSFAMASFAMAPKRSIVHGQNNVSSELRLMGTLMALIARDLIWETHDSLSTFSSMITWDDYNTLIGFAPRSYGPLHPDDKEEASSGSLRL